MFWHFFGSIWIYWDLFGSIWVYLDLFGSIWIYLDRINVHSETPTQPSETITPPFRNQCETNIQKPDETAHVRVLNGRSEFLTGAAEFLNGAAEFLNEGF